MEIKMKVSALIMLLAFIACSQQHEKESADSEMFSQNEFSESSNERLEFLYGKASTYYEQKQFDIAILYLDTLIGLDSLNGDYYFKRGYSKAQIDKFEASSKDFLLSVNLQYKVSKSYFNIGMNEVAQNNDSLAIVYLKKSAEADPFDLRVREMLNLLEKVPETSN